MALIFDDSVYWYASIITGSDCINVNMDIEGWDEIYI